MEEMHVSWEAASLNPLNASPCWKGKWGPQLRDGACAHVQSLVSPGRAGKTHRNLENCHLSAQTVLDQGSRSEKGSFICLELDEFAFTQQQLGKCSFPVPKAPTGAKSPSSFYNRCADFQECCPDSAQPLHKHSIFIVEGNHLEWFRDILQQHAWFGRNYLSFSSYFCQSAESIIH